MRPATGGVPAGVPPYIKRKEKRIVLITREMMVKRLSEKSGYWQKDVRNLLQCMDEVILECFGEVADDEEVIIQLVKGIRCGCKVVEAHQGVNPSTQESIFIDETVKPFCRFSSNFRKQIQDGYSSKEDG